MKVERRFVVALVAIGIALRVGYYLFNPSLTVDEASLALNVMHRSYSSLLARLDFNQAAPAGFLLLQKLLVHGLGATPYVFRVVPLVAGILASLLIYPVAKRVVGRRGAILALALLAVSEPLITYACTNKQYSVDVAAALGMYALAFRIPTRTGIQEALWLASAGAVAVWLSHPAAFVLAAIGIVLIFGHARARRWSDAARVVVVATVWLSSFIVAYALTRSSAEQIQHSTVGSDTSSVLGDRGRPGLLQTYGGIARSLFGIPSFGHGIRTALAVIAMLLALVGLVVLLRADGQYARDEREGGYGLKPRSARNAVLLTLPAGIALIACAFHLYPLYPRTFLFLIPALVILVPAGARSLSAPGRPRFLSLVAATAVATLLGTAVYATIDHLRSPAEAAPAGALRYLARNARIGDSLYVYLTAQYDFRYYLECGCFGPSNEVRKAKALWPIRAARGHAQFAPALRSAPPALIAGDATSPAAADYRSDFRPLRGRRRVWVLVIDANPEDQRGLETFLDQHGTRNAFFSPSREEAVASVFLYDLRASS
jgi:hypothetical protein